MHINFYKAYKITPLDGSTPVIAVGIKHDATRLENGFLVDKYVYLVAVDESPGRIVYAREIKDDEEYRIIRDIVQLVEEGIDLQYKIEPLNLARWHEMREYVPYYDKLFDSLRTDDDLNAYYIQELLEPNLSWYNEEVLPGRG